MHYRFCNGWFELYKVIAFNSKISTLNEVHVVGRLPIQFGIKKKLLRYRKIKGLKFKALWNVFFPLL